MDFMTTMKNKYTTSYTQKIKQIIAVPIDIETPREKEKEEKKAAEELKKKAKTLVKPIVVKLKKDLEDFAKKYCVKEEEGLYTPFTVNVKDMWEHSWKPEYIFELKAEKSTYLEIHLSYYKNKKDHLGEPILYWSKGGSSSSDKDITYQNYSELETYMSEALNKPRIVKNQEKKKHESKFEPLTQDLKPKIAKIKKAMESLAANYQIQYNNHPSPSDLVFVDNTKKNTLAAFSVQYNSQNRILKVDIHHEDYVPYLSLYSDVDSIRSRLAHDDLKVDVKEVEKAIETAKTRLVKK